jgi:hypothetical protein
VVSQTRFRLLIFPDCPHIEAFEDNLSGRLFPNLLIYVVYSDITQFLRAESATSGGNAEFAVTDKGRRKSGDRMLQIWHSSD